MSDRNYNKTISEIKNNDMPIGAANNTLKDFLARQKSEQPPSKEESYTHVENAIEVSNRPQEEKEYLLTTLKGGT